MDCSQVYLGQMVFDKGCEGSQLYGRTVKEGPRHGNEDDISRSVPAGFSRGIQSQRSVVSVITVQ